MSYGTIRVNGEDLPLTRRGRIIVDGLTVVGVIVYVWLFVVIAAFAWSV
jgi:hypothetical protein